MLAGINPVYGVELVNPSNFAFYSNSYVITMSGSDNHVLNITDYFKDVSRGSCEGIVFRISAPDTSPIDLTIVMDEMESRCLFKVAGVNGFSSVHYVTSAGDSTTPETVSTIPTSEFMTNNYCLIKVVAIAI